MTASRRWYLLVGGLALSGATARTSVDPVRYRSAPATAALTQAVANYDKAQVSGDGEALRRYLADDYLLVDGAGSLETKAQLIADFTAPGYKLDSFTVERPAIRVWQGAAVYGGEVRLSGVNGGKRFTAHIRFADIWRLRENKWQVVFTQVTRFAR